MVGQYHEPIKRNASTASLNSGCIAARIPFTFPAWTAGVS